MNCATFASLEFRVSWEGFIFHGSGPANNFLRFLLLEEKERKLLKYFGFSFRILRFLNDVALCVLEY